MYATIRRYEVSGASIDDLAVAGNGLGMALGQAPGFIAAVAVEEGENTLLTIGLFEDRASLDAAEPLAQRWTAMHRSALGLVAREVAVREVIAQKGL
jgi:hypothetical protein